MTNKTATKILVFTIIYSLIISGSSATSLSIKNELNLKEENDIFKSSSGNTIYVDDDGGQDYTDIQDAVDNATDGDTVFVYNGLYHGFTINKRLNVIGENRENTIIIVGEKTVEIRCDWSSLSGFTINDSQSVGLSCYVRAGANNITISDCYIYTGGYGGLYGIMVGGPYSVDGNYKKENILVKDCEIEGFAYKGIEVYLAYNSRIENCKVHKCGKGIDLWAFDGPHNNYVYNCEIFDNEKGIFLDYINDYVSNCYIHDNENGIEMYTAKYCQVTGCIIENNSVLGCYLRPYSSNIGRISTKFNLILGNKFINNKMGILLDYYVVDNQIHHNNFVNNAIYNAFDETNINKWDDGKYGNYWDDYSGSDDDGDGIGDSPYIIRGKCKDNYPFINQISMENIKPDKPTILGDATGIQSVAYTFSAKSIDPNFDFVFYEFDWGDGTSSGRVGPFAYNITGTASHIWRNNGIYSVKVRAEDIKGLKSDWSEKIKITISGNNRPEKPIINGPSEGLVGYNTNFLAVATDRDGDDIRYCFDFDNSRREWTRYYQSGETATLSYIWDWEYLEIPIEKTYNVKVKAQDSEGAESEWSDPLAITIKNNPPTIPIIRGSGEGKWGKAYWIYLSSTDPDNHQIAFDIEWGNGDETWTGGYNSGENIDVSHDYDPGEYTIKVRAYDQYGAVSSDWATHKVVIKISRAIDRSFINNFLQKLILYFNHWNEHIFS